jgi:low affinity Fe/Cu permease
VTTTEVTVTDLSEAPQVAAVRETLRRRLRSRYGRFCDWVSEAMGRPLNITFWFVAIVVWTFIFAFGGPHLASGKWMPAWFTSTGYNFPLNLATTVAELFIGFLVATAANRSQNALTALLNHMQTLLDGIVAHGESITAQGKQLSAQSSLLSAQTQQIEELARELKAAVEENTELTRQVHTLTAEAAQDTDRLEGLKTHMTEVHDHVRALTRHAGLQTGKADSG